MTMGEFQEAVHEYSKETFEYSPLSKKYAPLVYSDTKKISMVDPSGGPYITIGMPANMFIPKMEGTITGFELIETGYKMIIE